MAGRNILLKSGLDSIIPFQTSFFGSFQRKEDSFVVFGHNL